MAFLFDPSIPTHARAIQRFSSEEVIWLTTVTPEGQPQPSPVWFWWDGQEFLIYSGESSRIGNLRANSRVALNFNSDEDGDDAAIVEGLARVDNATPRADQVPGYVRRYDKLLPGIGMTWESFCDHYRFPIRIRPVRFRGW